MGSMGSINNGKIIQTADKNCQGIFGGIYIRDNSVYCRLIFS